MLFRSNQLVETRVKVVGERAAHLVEHVVDVAVVCGVIPVVENVLRDSVIVVSI